MLHEPASSPDYVPVSPEPRPETDDLSNRPEKIRKLVARVMDITHEIDVDLDDLGTEDRVLFTQNKRQLFMSLAGLLDHESEDAYNWLDAQLAPMQMTPIFREYEIDDEVHVVVHILSGRFDAVEGKRGRWVSVVLFIATFISVLIVGTHMAIGELLQVDPQQALEAYNNFFRQLWRGLPYGLSIMLILGAHEAGHYIMMRRHGVLSTLPYFIPMPFIEVNPFGTFGAAIVLKGPVRNRKHLLDIGVAGPLAGLVFALPILLIGLATSPIVQPSGGMTEGNSVLYIMAKLAVFGEFLPLPHKDVLVNQMAWAGWTGLFVTALNLLPLGQLDGGHVLYSLLGERARSLFYPLIIAMLALMLFVSSVWLLLLLLLFLMGRHYAIPLDAVTTLDPRREKLAWLAIAIFMLTFVPVPLSQEGAQGGLLMSGILATAISLIWQRLR